MRRKSNHVRLAPLVVVLACSSISSTSLAGVTFDITGASVIPGVGNTLVQKYFPQLAQQDANAGANLEALMNQAITQELPNFKQSVNDALTPLKDTSAFLGAMANSGAAAGKVMPFDYVTDPTLFSLSVAGGVAEHGLSLDDFKNFTLDTTKPLPNKGAAVTLSAMLGINLRAFDPPRWNYFDFSRLSLFVNFFAIDQDAAFGSKADINFKTFGLHGMYQLFDSHAVGTSGLLRWGGLSVGTGFDYSSLTVLYDADLPSSSTNTQTSQIGNTGETLPLTLAYQGSGKLGADIHIFSIPFEVMSHVQLAYFLSIYAGGGFDLNFGSASLAGDAAAPVTITATDPQSTSNTPDTANGVTVSQPDATLTLSGNSSVTVGDFRGYVGLQVNLLAVAVFAQVNADTSNTIAANAGLRIFW